MDFLWDKITEWLKEMLISGISSNLSGMFDATNQKVAEISGQVGLTPQAWNGSVFNMVRSLSENVIVPIAGVILAFVMTLELIQLITDKNNLNDVDTWMFFKWAFKSAAAVLIVTNTWNIVMGVFDVAQSVVSSASGVMVSDTSIDISSVLTDLETRLAEMDIGPLFGLWFQSMFVNGKHGKGTIGDVRVNYSTLVHIRPITCALEEAIGNAWCLTRRTSQACGAGGINGASQNRCTPRYNAFNVVMRIEFQSMNYAKAIAQRSREIAHARRCTD